MKRRMDGSASAQILALILVAALLLALGATALAEENESVSAQAALAEAPVDKIQVDEPVTLTLHEDGSAETLESKMPIEDSFAAAAREFSALDWTQRLAYRQIWTDNYFVRYSMDDMMALYDEIGGLSRRAQFLMYLSNAMACLRFSNEHYQGDDVFLTEFNGLCAAFMRRAAEADVNGEDELAAMFDAYREGIAGLNEIKEAESAATGEDESFSALFLSYEGEAAAADAAAFFAQFDTDEAISGAVLAEQLFDVPEE